MRQSLGAILAAILSIGLLIYFHSDSGGAATMPTTNASQPSPSPDPNPKLKPDEVIRIQLDALKDNDKPEKDSGIREAFKFASPGNKQSTGPIERFNLLVKSPAYLPMLNHQNAEYGPLEVQDDVAQQLVKLTDAGGATVYYRFTVSRQRGGLFDGCWMTDGVEYLTAEEAKPRPGNNGNGHFAI